MDSLLNSQVLEAMINAHMKNIVSKDSENAQFFNLLTEQQSDQYIIVNDPIYKDGHYYYQINTQHNSVERRYGDFELLSEYLFKANPNIIQRMLPQKESGLAYLKSYLIENKDLLNQRKEKFQIFLNDLKKKIPDNTILNYFLQVQRSFEEKIKEVDISILENQKYLQRIKKYSQSWIQRNNIDEELKKQQQIIEIKIMQLDQILSNLITLYLNLQHQTKTVQVKLQNIEIQQIINNIIENQEKYYQEKIANRIERLTKKIEEIVEIFPNVRQEKSQYNSYEIILDECFKLIISTLNEIIQ